MVQLWITLGSAKESVAPSTADVVKAWATGSFGASPRMLSGIADGWAVSSASVEMVSFRTPDNILPVTQFRSNLLFLEVAKGNMPYLAAFLQADVSERSSSVRPRKDQYTKKAQGLTQYRSQTGVASDLELCGLDSPSSCREIFFAVQGFEVATGLLVGHHRAKGHRSNRLVL